MVDDDPNQYLFYTDTFASSSTSTTRCSAGGADKQVLTRFFRDFLLAQQPDIVHFQHTIFLGYDIVRESPKNTLPDVPIVYTLHEYVPICHRDGQMVRTLQRGSSARRSRRAAATSAFPRSRPQTFYMRKRFIQSHLSLVDLFIAPSEYVRDRYVDWGLPADEDRRSSRRA